MIIDIHAHTSRHNMRGLHVILADLDDLWQYAERYGISKICLMATSFPFKGTGLSNRDLLERIGGDKRFGCFGTIDASKNDLAEIWDLKRLVADGLIDGLKLYPGYQNFVLYDSGINWFYQLAQQYSLSVAVHLGELHHCCPEDKRTAGVTRCGRKSCPLDRLGRLSHPQCLTKAAKQFPKVKFIACHLANPYFADLRDTMAECPNVYTDISGQFVSGTAEDTPEYRQYVISEIKQFLQLPGGLERVMFATDFPIQSYADSLALVEALNLKPSEKQLLLSGNAKRLLSQAQEGGRR